MLNKVKNKVKTSKTFWMLRHLISKDVWLNYYDSHSTDRRCFYSKYVNENNYETVFEFGCASGPNLKNIELYSCWKTYFFGYDINSAAIEFAKKKFEMETSVFSTKISISLFEESLNRWEKSIFDLAIYDRVLYLLSDNEVFDHFSHYHKFFTTVVIDDFHNSQYLDANDAYSSKNYENILSNFGFRLVVEEKTEHIIVDEFFERSAKRLIFQKI